MAPRRLVALFLLATLLASCREQPTSIGALTVAPEFEPFWRQGGGLTTFGPPISAVRREGQRLRQTFLAVELIQEKVGSRKEVRLAPLGWELGLAEPPAAPIEGQSVAYFPVTGHTLYAGFADMYSRIGGEAVAGAPISEVAFRDGQIVQYFENLGLYRPENASPADTRLVALGIGARPPADSFGLDPEAFVLPGLIRQRPFAEFLQAFGGEAVFGQPLTEPYLIEDGSLQQVYERAVVFSSDGSMRRAAFRPLGAELGPATSAAPKSKEAGGAYFQETGHNVLWAFADFYRANDGERLLGLPLEEASLQPNRLTQRFQNGVLEYHYDLPPDLAAQLAPLGRRYLAQHPSPTARPEKVGVAVSPSGEAPAEKLRVEASLAQVTLDPGGMQSLVVEVSSRNGAPVPNASVLIRWVTSENEREERLPRTNDQGRTEWQWTDADPVSGEVITLLVQATSDGAGGTALLQYAYRFVSTR